MQGDDDVGGGGGGKLDVTKKYTASVSAVSISRMSRN